MPCTWMASGSHSQKCTDCTVLVVYVQVQDSFNSKTSLQICSPVNKRIEMGVNSLLELPTTYLLTAILEQAPSSLNYCRMFWLRYIEVCHLCVDFTLDKLLPLPSLQFGWTQKPFLHQSFQLKFLSRFQLVLKTTVGHLHHCHPFCLVDLKNP